MTEYVVSVAALLANWTNSEAASKVQPSFQASTEADRRAGSTAGNTTYLRWFVPREAVAARRLLHRARDALDGADHPEEDVPFHGREEQEEGADLVPDPCRKDDYRGRSRTTGKYPRMGTLWPMSKRGTRIRSAVLFVAARIPKRSPTPSAMKYTSATLPSESSA